MAGDKKPTKQRKRGALPKEGVIVPETPEGGTAKDAKQGTLETATPADPVLAEATNESTKPEEKAVQSRRNKRDPRKPSFLPETLDSTVIAMPLLKELENEKLGRKNKTTLKPKLFDVIIDLNLEYFEGRDKARTWVTETIKTIIGEIGKTQTDQGISEIKTSLSQQYVFARLEGDVLRELVNRDGQRQAEPRGGHPLPKNRLRAAYHIWPDFPIGARINKSISTVKADAAQNSFAAVGEDIVWAVLDSGIDKNHPHFAVHKNLILKEPLIHRDLTKLADGNDDGATTDAFGHGTHVAGIIAGAMRVGEKPADDQPPVEKIRAYSKHRDEHGEVTYDSVSINAISGMAPKCKLLSLKVLDENGDGLASNLIAAIALIQDLNGHGRRLLVHGVNMSVGYEFEPEWFACGQSPLCVEVDRLVRSGVVVVVSAGNTGYGVAQSTFRGVISAGMDLTINDPGNADMAITVGSTHKDMPHVYGVSYFSSKGPTGDGRAKPDLVAPGEKILSCATGQQLAEMKDKAGICDYLEQSGTSMAAPHVSGVIAAFLSIRREFIGYPEKVKEVFLSTATDLKRERYFQGHGLVDLMRAIQSV
ncbi:MAG: S8 family peptidase [Acidobacteriota bacterium]